jgi:hypothetical protein
MKNNPIMLALALLFSVLGASAQNWFPIASGTNKKLNTIHFPSSSVGYIGGEDSLLLKSTDGGISWNPVTMSGINFLSWNSDILNLQFLNDSVGYLTLGPYATSYKTVDGGLNWTANPMVGNKCYNHGMYFFDQDNGFIGGSGCFQGELIDKLTNGIWSPATMNSSTWSAQNMIVDIDFYNTQLGLAASTGGNIFRTTNGGQSWDSIFVSSNMNPLTSVLMINDTLAYAGYKSVSVGFGLYISTDGGLSWSEDINSATFFYPDFLALHQTNGGDVYAGGYSTSSQTGLIFKSPGNIFSWNYDAVDQAINDISSYNDSTVFAVGDSGYIVVNRTLTGLNQMEENIEFIPVVLSPNPAQQYFSILLPEKTNASEFNIRIFSMFGELVLLERNLNVIDVQNLSSGIYLVEVTGDGFAGHGKLIIE